MPAKNRSDLKGRFVAGSRPSQQDFADLIDSQLNLADDNLSQGVGSDGPTLHFGSDVQFTKSLTAETNASFKGSLNFSSAKGNDLTLDSSLTLANVQIKGIDKDALGERSDSLPTASATRRYVDQKVADLGAGLLMRGEVRVVVNAETMGQVVISTDADQPPSGLPKIDGVQLIKDDLVLVALPARSGVNRVWKVAAGSWSPAGPEYGAEPGQDMKLNAAILVKDGTLAAGTVWKVTELDGKQNQAVWTRWRDLDYLKSSTGLKKQGTLLSVDSDWLKTQIETGMEGKVKVDAPLRYEGGRLGANLGSGIKLSSGKLDVEPAAFIMVIKAGDPLPAVTEVPVNGLVVVIG